MSNEYPFDIDCVWIASDRKGRMGAFVTAGVAPIPLSIVQSNIEIPDIHERILALPSIAQVTLLIKEGTTDFFAEIAARGFYVYDWEDVHRTASRSTNKYELVAVPHVELKVDSLDSAFLKAASLVDFCDVDFSDTTQLDVSLYGPVAQNLKW